MEEVVLRPGTGSVRAARLTQGRCQEGLSGCLQLQPPRSPRGHTLCVGTVSAAARLTAAEGPAPAGRSGLRTSRSVGTGVVSGFDCNESINNHIECELTKVRDCFVEKSKAVTAARGKQQ